MMIALLPPNSSKERPKRSATCRATSFPILVLPVAETNGILLSFESNSPTL